MADERISGFFAPEALQELETAKASLRELVNNVVEANTVAKKAEGFSMQATSIKEVSTAQTALVNAQGQLISSTSQLNKTLVEAAALKERYNGSTKDVLQTGQQLIRLNADEAKTQQQVNKALAEGEKVRTQAAKTSTELARNRQAEARATEAEMRAEQTRQKIAAKGTQEQLGQYAMLKKAYKQAAEAAKELGVAEGLNSLKFKQAAADAKKMYDVLYAVESAVGQNQRGVGQYERGSAGLSMAVQQILREAPSAVNSLNTFFLAISNNLPILFDEIQKVNKAQVAANEATAAEAVLAKEAAIAEALKAGATAEAAAAQGLLAEETIIANAAAKASPGIFKQLLNSLFSLNTGLTVIVFLLTAFGAKAAETVKSLFTFGKAASDAKESAERFTKALESTEYAEAKKNVAELTENIKLAKEGFLDKDQVVRQFNETIGKTIGEAKNLNEAEALLAANAERYIEFTQLKAAATEAFAQSAKESVKAQTELAEVGTGRTAIGYFLTLGTGMGAKEASDFQRKEEAKKAQEQADKLLRIGDDFQKRAAQLAKKYKFDFFSGTEDAKKDKKPQDLTNERLKAEAEATKQLYEQLKLRAEIQADIQKSIADNEKKSYAVRLEAFQKYTKSRLEVAGYDFALETQIAQQRLDKIAEIEKKRNASNEEKNLLLEKPALLLKLSNLRLQYERAVNGIVQDGADFRQAIAKKEAKAATDVINDNLQKAKKAADESFKDYLDGIKRQSDAKKRQNEELNLYVDAAISAERIIDSFASAASNRRIAEAEAEIEAIKKRGEADILAYQQSAAFAVASEAERTQKIAEIQETANAKAIQAEQALREEKRKRAQTEKAVNIAEIIIKTALAVVNQLAGGDPYTAIPRALAAGALGAAELAAAIATPIPEFAEGGTMEKSGFAIVDEKGPELFKRPDGSMYVGSDKGPRLDYLQAGTQIIPHEELMRLANYYTAMPVMMQQQQAMDTRALEDAMDKQTKVLAAEIRNKKETIVNLHNLGIQHLIKSGNSVTTRLHNIKH